MTIEKSLLGAHTRARVDNATACHYAKSGRVVLIADKADFVAAVKALLELSDVVSDEAGQAALQTCLNGCAGV